MTEPWKRDPYGAFMRETHVERRGAPGGALSGSTFAVKDVFDVAGTHTGFGSPEWLATHPAAARTAPVVEWLLQAGADLVGRAVSDELVYSLEGANAHYGTPINPRAPQNLPGGSSSGSAVAVAGGLVDFALGTDCGGSVRIPASYCGVWGFRPTHGCVPLDGIPAFAPSFDTVGWFAREPGLLARLGEVLIRAPQRRGRPARLLVASDAYDAMDGAAADALRAAVGAIAARIGEQHVTRVVEGDRGTLADTFRTIQAFEVWQSLGGWVATTQPALGPGVRERFQWAATVTPAQYTAALARRDAFRQRLALLEPDDVLCIPTAAGIAPHRDSTAAEREAARGKALNFLAIAGLGGLPQMNLPLAASGGCPLGVSLVASAKGDAMLLDFARREFAPGAA